MVGLIAGVIFLGGGSLILALLARIDTLPRLLLAAGTLALAQVVVAAQLLSVVGALGRTGWLAFHAVVATVALLFWLRSGRPRPSWPSWPTVADARAHPAVTIAVLLAVGAAGLQLLVGLTTAPANWDSMTYHLSRAAYWLQNGTIARFDGGSVRQLSSAPNAEIAFAWAMTMAGRDTFVQCVQWLALSGCAIALWTIVRELGFNRAAAAFAAAVFVMLPQPIVQATTTQNDLTVSALLLTTIAFGLRAVRRGTGADMVLAALALGLALGTKGTMLFALPALGLVLLAAWRTWRTPSRTLVRLVAGAAVAALALGAGFSYVANLAVTGKLDGGLAAIADPPGSRVKNAVHLGWSFVDSPGVGVDWVNRGLASTLGRVSPGFSWVLDTSTGADTVAAGLVGLIVLLPLAVLVAADRRRPLVLRALAAGALVYVLAAGLVQAATPFNGRILLPAMALMAPLLALAAARSWSRTLVLVLAATSLLPVLFTNPEKIVLGTDGQPAVWHLTRNQQLTITRPPELALMDQLDATYHAGSRLAFLGGEDSWDYPLFGERLARVVVPVDPAAIPVDSPEHLCTWLRDLVRRERLDALVFSDAPREVPAPPAVLGVREVSESNYLVPAGRLDRCGAAAGS